MKTDIERAALFVDSLDKNRQIAFLARLIYELTLAGRACYSHESTGLEYPTRLREINELQHKLSAQIMSVMSDGLHGLSSGDLVRLFIERQYSDGASVNEIRTSFFDAVAAFCKQNV